MESSGQSSGSIVAKLTTGLSDLADSVPTTSLSQLVSHPDKRRPSCMGEGKVSPRAYQLPLLAIESSQNFSHLYSVKARRCLGRAEDFRRVDLRDWLASFPSLHPNLKKGPVATLCGTQLGRNG